MTTESPPRVLLVDDDEMVSSVLARAIALLTPEVSVLADGSAALAALREATFDVVVTDLRMPGASGVAIAEWVQRAGAPTEVIVMSGFLRDGDEAAIHAAGARFLRKPFGASQLLDAVEAALARLRARAG